MFEKLQDIKARFEELNGLLMKPEVLAEAGWSGRGLSPRPTQQCPVNGAKPDSSGDAVALCYVA